MESLIDLALPWWQFPLRAVIVYVALLVLIRLSGKRTVGEFTPFDLVLMILLGNAMQNAMVGPDTSVLGGLVVVATLLLLNAGIAMVSARSRKFERLVEGTPVVLVRNGRIFESALKAENVAPAALDESLRKAGCKNVAEVELAVLETDGQITVIARSQTGAKRRHGGQKPKSLG